jgi:hypothetical protein
LPSRDSSPEDSTEPATTVKYVDDWFEYEQFDDAFSVLLEFGDDIPDASTWKANGVDYWPIYLRSFFSQGRGNFKYLYPIASGVRRTLDDREGTVVFVWPERDVVTHIVETVATGSDDTAELEIRTEPKVSNPIPNPYHGDSDYLAPADTVDLASQLSLYVRVFGYLLALHLSLIAGQLLPRTKTSGRNIVYAPPSHRELTETIVTHDTVTASLLHPKLLPPLRSLLNGNLSAAKAALSEAWSGGRIGAEDVFLGSVLTVEPYRQLYGLLRTRERFDAQLQQYLCDRELGRLPTDYLYESFEAAFASKDSVKLIAYLSLFSGTRGIDTLTSVSGCETQSLLFELGRRFDIDTVDLNHSVLMNEPPEIRNRADVVAVKGEPDMERLVAEEKPSRLVLTGRPYTDKLYTLLNAAEPTTLPAVFDMNRTVVVATEPIRREHIDRVLSGVFESQRADAVCIKLHPKESKSSYRKLLEEIETDGTDYELVYDEYDLFDLIRACDALVTISSNVGLEALFLGIPGIHVTAPPNVELYYQTDPYFEPYMTPVENVAKTVDEYLDTGLDAATAAEIRDSYYVDGHASDRVIADIYT